MNGVLRPLYALRRVVTKSEFSVTSSARPPPTNPPEQDWRVALRIHWEEQLETTEALVESGQLAPEFLENDRTRMARELEHADEIPVRFADGEEITLREMYERRAATLHARGLPPDPRLLRQDAMRQRWVGIADARIQDERTSPESRLHFLRLRGVLLSGGLTQHAGDLVGALLARARQGRRSPRARERRPRRSGRSSRDGPDEPPDDPDDLDRARRGRSS
jgi:hypothetical protein